MAQDDNPKLTDVSLEEIEFYLDQQRKNISYLYQRLTESDITLMELKVMLARIYFSFNDLLFLIAKIRKQIDPNTPLVLFTFTIKRFINSIKNVENFDLEEKLDLFRLSDSINDFNIKLNTPSHLFRSQNTIENKIIKLAKNLYITFDSAEFYAISYSPRITDAFVWEDEEEAKEGVCKPQR